MTQRERALTKALDATNFTVARLTETVSERDAEIQTLTVRLKRLDLLDARVATLEAALATAYRERDESRRHNGRLRDRLVKQNRQAVAALARIVKMYERVRAKE